MIKKYIRIVYKVFSVGSMLALSFFYTLFFKVFLLINGVEYGKNVKTNLAIPKLHINKNAKHVWLGNNVTFNNYTDVSWYCKSCIYVNEGASFIMGDNSGMNGVLVYCANNVEIGKFVNIGGGTRIIDTDFHNLNWQFRRDPAYNLKAKTAPIIIEDDVFIGTNCIILKGVTIGARTVIAAGSVVTKDIPSDCLAAGNPCKVIKSLIENV